MSRNDYNRFEVNPVSTGLKRSTFKRPYNVKTAFKSGDLVPFYLDEVLPGDTFKVETSILARMATPLHPVMDNAFLDYYFFFVPNRLVWNHWNEFMGENTQSAWANTTEYQIPCLGASPNAGYDMPEKGTQVDYFGLPLGRPFIRQQIGNTFVDTKVSHLPFRAYALIWNEWFRKQAFEAPIPIERGDSDVEYVLNPQNDYQRQCGGKLLPVAKFSDYFTSALPSPQKGEATTIPIDITFNIPESEVFTKVLDEHNFSEYAIKYKGAIGSVGYGLDVAYGQYAFRTQLPSELPERVLIQPDAIAGDVNVYSQNQTQWNRNPLVPVNLYSASKQVSQTIQQAFSVNELRLAFQIQKLLERDARGGTRYVEVIRAHFNTISDDARQQRPEYLGGQRIPINMTQVEQTGATVQGVSPQGNLAAYSLTRDSSGSFTKSFTEHGMVIGVMCVRHRRSYQEGIDRFWSRRRRLDFYFPVFANIGEQPIFKKEIFISGNASMAPSGQVEEVFGYKPPWEEYRHSVDKITGDMRRQGGLDFWHYGDWYGNPNGNTVNLNAEFITEQGNSNIPRTLAVQQPYPDILADIYVENISTRGMPLHAIPSLIDHN